MRHNFARQEDGNQHLPSCFRYHFDQNVVLPYIQAAPARGFQALRWKEKWLIAPRSMLFLEGNG